MTCTHHDNVSPIVQLPSAFVWFSSYSSLHLAPDDHSCFIVSVVVCFLEDHSWIPVAGSIFRLAASS